MPDFSKLPFPPTVAQLYAKILWDPKPTTTVKSERQLAYALGYPSDWRVERTVTSVNGKSVINDRIHALFGKKKKSQYTWFHHEAAQQAAAQLEQEGTLEGSHLLPPVPLYTKGDAVEVIYEGKWWAAYITKRKKQGDNFLYSVVYKEDGATQDELMEEEIRPGMDPGVLAAEMGFPEGWLASRKGSRYMIYAPTGEQFTTKKAALKFLKDQFEPEISEEEDVGDPPWRKEGHELIGRKVSWSSYHKVSGSRKVKVDQVGVIEAYIDENDVDKEGNPGFVSTITGEPAPLFHIVFPADPHHAYSSYLIDSQDVEEHELEGCLIEETAAEKRKRTAGSSTKPSPKKKRGRRR